MLLDIVILPPAQLRQKLGNKIKQATKDYPHIFVVDNKKLIPHVSLFHIRSSKQKLEEMSQIIQKVIKNYKPTKMKSVGFDVGEESGRSGFGIGLSNSKELKKLHGAIVYSCRGLRTGMMPFTSKRKATKLEQYYRENFGSRHILKHFYPHITLVMLKNVEDSRRVEKEFKDLKLEFVPDEIATTEVNFWHQVTRVIKKFPLSFRARPKAESRDPSTSVGMTQEAIKVLKHGGIVVYPTDTSYGLAVDATSLKAVKKLYQLKGRNFKKPVHVIAPVKHSHTTVYGSKWLSRIVRTSSLAKRLMKKFWPGPLTIVLPLKAKGKSWQMLSAGTKTLGIRYPDNSTAQTLSEALKRPITTTSANLAGKPSCYTIAAIKKQFVKSKSKPNFYLEGGRLPKRRPSTVVSLVDPTPSPSPRQGRGVLSRSKTFRVKILRVGPISEKQIKKAMK